MDWPAGTDSVGAALLFHLRARAGSLGLQWPARLMSTFTPPHLSFPHSWFNFVGNAAGDAAFAYGFAQVIGAARTIQNCPVDIDRLYAVAALPNYKVSHALYCCASTMTSLSPSQHLQDL